MEGQSRERDKRSARCNTIIGDFQQQAYCKRGKGLIKVNGRPLELVQPEALSFKLQEPILLLGTSGQGQVC